MVEECSDRTEGRLARATGVVRSKNVGISNNTEGENPSRRKSKGSRATIVVPGLAGPKSQPQGVGPMEKRADIPVPPISF